MGQRARGVKRWAGVDSGVAAILGAYSLAAAAGALVCLARGQHVETAILAGWAAALGLAHLGVRYSSL